MLPDMIKNRLREGFTAACALFGGSIAACGASGENAKRRS